MKLRITISKYHPWYLCQISLKKKSCYYLYKYWPIFRMKQNLSFCIVVLMIWIGNTVNHLWNKHKHCSKRKIEAALLFSSSVIYGSAELFARGKNWNGVMMARFVFLFLVRATFRETAKKMDVKNCQCYCKKKQTNKSKSSKPCSETLEHLDVILMINNFKSTNHRKIVNLLN